MALVVHEVIEEILDSTLVEEEMQGDILFVIARLLGEIRDLLRSA